MPNLFDYLEWRGDLNIKNDAFNDIDALILSRLSYLPFDGIVSHNTDEAVTIKDASKMFFSTEDYKKKLLWEGDEELFRTLAKSDRFSNMELSGYINIIESERQMQFSAIVIKMSKDSYFVSFRGTDNSIIGWQEDFNMYYMFPLPSQEMALEYLNDVAKRLRGSFILGGHSKGGNLAVYSAVFSDTKVQKRIEAVYNHDGPGFDSKVIEESSFNAIKEKIHTYVPQSSIFGMMFEHQEDYTIVKSTQKGFLQHDIYSWEVKRTNLIPLNHMTNTSVFFDHTLTQFASSLTVDQRKDFIEAVFSLLETTEDKTFNEILDNWVKNSTAIFKAFKNMDSKTRNMIITTLLDFIKCAKNNFSDINPLKKSNRKNKTKLQYGD